MEFGGGNSTNIFFLALDVKAGGILNSKWLMRNVMRNV